MDKNTIRLVLADLTLGDLEAYENATGGDLMVDLQPKRVIDPVTKMPVPDPDSPEGRPLLKVQLSSLTYIGLVYLGALRENPKITFDEVRRMKLAEIDFHLVMETEEPDPLEPPSDGPIDSENG